MPPTYKIVLLGDSSVGKSSLVQRFSLDSYNEHLPNTIGAAYISKEHTSGTRTVTFEIWDTAGQERYKSLTPMYYRNAKEALVCFDLSAINQSFKRARFWVDQLLMLGPEDISIKIVGNKSDLADVSDPSLLEIEQFCEEKQLPFFQTSAKLGTGVTEIFDSIVDGIDQVVFDNYTDPETLVSLENILTMTHLANSSCC